MRFPVILSLVLFCPQESLAEGALAVGLPSDVAKHGFAFGAGWNGKSSESAQAEALRNCRRAPNSSEATRALCRVVQTFEHQCFAFAMDRDLGTPGIGWAISSSLEAAEREAISLCSDTAGEDRRQFCEISLSNCDLGL